MKSNIHHRVTENTEIFFFVCPEEIGANENHQPYRAKMIFFLQEQVLFAHRRLPMGKKEKPSVPLW